MANNKTLTNTRTHNSFSGVDMLVSFGGTLIGEVQGISYTVQREKAPIYTMGSADPRSFSRGKRGIAGSAIFMVFDRSALLDTMQTNTYAAWKGDTSAGTEVTGINLNAAAVIAGSTGFSPGGALSTITLDKIEAYVRYHDQIRPFDIVITAANEYGYSAFMKIMGVEIINAGSGMSVDDITTDESCTFIATGIDPWKSQPPHQFKGA